MQIIRRAAELLVDPGEATTVIWQWWVNSVLGSFFVPGRLRTLGLRLAGIDIALSALVRPRVIIRARSLHVDTGSTINYGCVFDNRTEVRIGRDVGVGIGVSFITTDHRTSDPRRRAGLGRSAPIVVGDGVFIGSRATILPGVHIGDGVVIAAGAVVISDCEPHTLYGGTPARPLRALSDGYEDGEGLGIGVDRV